jgi:hypothetical protein
MAISSTRRRIPPVAYPIDHMRSPNTEIVANVKVKVWCVMCLLVVADDDVVEGTRIQRKDALLIVAVVFILPDPHASQARNSEFTRFGSFSFSLATLRE